MDYLKKNLSPRFFLAGYQNMQSQKMRKNVEIMAEFLLFNCFYFYVQKQIKWRKILAADA